MDKQVSETIKKGFDEKKTLVILAAGMGRRFGGGIKQLEAVGPSGETMMDYSIYGAREAGFEKVIFVINDDFKDLFINTIGEKTEKMMDVGYAYPAVNLGKDAPAKLKKKASKRKEPWGTTCSLLSAKDMINGPFAVINADDYYGKESYKILFDFLTGRDHADENKRHNIAMVGYHLRNTLSSNGPVTRGICTCNEEGTLVNITETKGIKMTEDKIVSENHPKKIFSGETLVSMNMWGMFPEFLGLLEDNFYSYIESLEDVNEGECLLPASIDEILRENKINVKILKTNEKWFGITYKSDIMQAKAAVAEMTNSFKQA